MMELLTVAETAALLKTTKTASPQDDRPAPYSRNESRSRVAY